MADADRKVEPWQAWFERHGAGLLLFARQFLATREEAEDAVQNGFVRFWRSRVAGEAAAEARDPVAYLYGCVRRAALDVRRARRTRQRHELAAERHADGWFMPRVDGAMEAEERRRMLEGALNKLPEEQREVLILKIWSGADSMTFAQIAEVLDISANTAASRYRYALQRLYSLLSPEVIRE